MSETDGWWFVDPAGQKQGPFTWVALTELHAGYAIDDATLVWTSGMYEWETFSANLGRGSHAAGSLVVWHFRPAGRWWQIAVCANLP